MNAIEQVQADMEAASEMYSQYVKHEFGDRGLDAVSIANSALAIVQLAGLIGQERRYQAPRDARPGKYWCARAPTYPVHNE